MEIAAELQSLVQAALEKYAAQTGKQPKQVVFFRDGVGNSQKVALLNEEKTQLDNALGKIPYALIMVNKRIKTKIFHEEGGKLHNPKAGLVVDNAITPVQLRDFYLISASARQGTPTPSHYSVLHDSTELGMQVLEALTYKLCYLYFNYSGPVKIPAPVKLADRLANVIGEREGQKRG